MVCGVEDAEGDWAGTAVQSGTRECFELWFGGVLGGANGKRTGQGGVKK